ncbi:hypothetical protein GmRootA79_45040 [Acidovorax sp. A79]|uniref:ankyrin repeat domain-containing protein n=1 Tax=Acidovorax sp. A79 TaxID=3056107 RepID=UPI0034E8EEC8
MARGTTGKAGTFGARLAVLLLSAAFALGFGLGGYFVGLKPLALTLRAAWAVRGWQPVQAQVLAADLARHSDGDGTTWQVRARYRYEFAGRPYEGSRVGLDPTETADNIGDWHQRWHTQLQGAQARGARITIMVDPREPSRSLIDPSIRWALLMFRLPFALVFTAVGLGAAWVFLATLPGLGTSREPQGQGGGRPGPQAGVSAIPLPKGSAGSPLGAVWFFTFFWCGISFPMAGMLWTNPQSPWFAKAFIGLFVLVGMALLALAVRQTHMAWRYAGATLVLLPSAPRAGHPLEVTLLLPGRAAAYQQGHSLQLRLAQYRVDESSSGSPERCVESFTEAARMQHTSDGGLRLVARFEVPPDAPPHGSQRSGERVDWRVELLHNPDGAVELTYDLPVQAAPRTFGGDELPDRFDRRAAWQQEVPIVPLGEQEEEEEGSRPLPASVTLRETPQAWHYEFAQGGWRWAAGLVLAALLLESAIHGRLGPQGLMLPRGFFAAGAWMALAAFALHATTRHWTLTVQDGGITARRHSWLWSRADTVPGAASRTLVHKLLHSTGSGGSEHRYHAVYARGAGGALVRLTPGLAGEAAATALGQSLGQAWAHRRGRFAAGMQRPARAQHSRPAWGALLVLALLGWWIVGPQAGRTVGRVVGAEASASAATAPAVPYSLAEGRLLDAQNAGDAPALRDALSAGANPDLLAPNGSSVLMLAAHRGQLEHIEALLGAGAQPDLRQTRKDSERGDTALLRAFYGGHLAAARRLVQAGASLSARNRWDWGPVHMAAQGGCIPCLEWLDAQGQPLDEPAPASRGETPAMLAAGRGRVEALQWFADRGIDLARTDAHGKTALDWARFKQQAEAERWLMGRVR